MFLFGRFLKGVLGSLFGMVMFFPVPVLCFMGFPDLWTNLINSKFGQSHPVLIGVWGVLFLMGVVVLWAGLLVMTIYIFPYMLPKSIVFKEELEEIPLWETVMTYESEHEMWGNYGTEPSLRLTFYDDFFVIVIGISKRKYYYRDIASIEIGKGDNYNGILIKFKEFNPEKKLFPFYIYFRKEQRLKLACFILSNKTGLECKGRVFKWTRENIKEWIKETGEKD